VRFLVCGGRDFDNIYLVRHALLQIPIEAVLVHGNASGADRQCADFWGRNGGKVEAHPADWTRHGKAGGPIRNQEMLDSGVDLVIAFPGGRGTADMVRRAKKTGVRVIEL
jgi:hypothetical protein